MSVLFGLLLGLLQGLRHALEPDHVVALSTMIAEARTARTRVAYAAAWGLGHAAMLLVVGAVLMAARSRLPARLDAAFELGVAVMLVGLGLRALVHAARRVPGAAEAHGARPWRGVGPLAMGMVHGLAGSGALTALVMAELPSFRLGVAFMLLFGLGATLGMSLLAGLAGTAIQRLLALRWGAAGLLGATGFLSLGLGLLWIGPAFQGVFLDR